MLKRTRKKIIFLAGCLIFINLIGVCYAYLTEHSNKVNNTFELGSISCNIEEESFDGIIKDNVSVKNTSEVGAFIRSKIITTWMSKDGKSVYSETPEPNKDYIININEKDWFIGTDGFYYYKYNVESKSNTSVLIDEARLLEDVTPPNGYYLSIEIISSAIQSNPSHAIEEAWEVVSFNGTNLVLVN